MARICAGVNAAICAGRRARICRGDSAEIDRGAMPFIWLGVRDPISLLVIALMSEGVNPDPLTKSVPFTLVSLGTSGVTAISGALVAGVVTGDVVGEEEGAGVGVGVGVGVGGLPHVGTTPEVSPASLNKVVSEPQ